MSNDVNTRLLERAAYVSDQFPGTYLPQAIENLVKRGDLDKLGYLVADAEAELSREHFHNNDALPYESEPQYER